MALKKGKGGATVKKSKETKGGKRGTSRRRPSMMRTVSYDEDDGTQVEDSRRVRKKEPAKRQEKRRPQLDNPVTLAQLRKFCGATVQTGVNALVQQFQDIKNATGLCTNKNAFEANQSKNRYKDVPCTDKTRVILNWPSGGSDYIHANWVNFMGEKKFICTQGPIESTVDDFWRLIWQEKVKAIVMLCEVMEQGKKKCEAYWPSGSGKKMSVESGLVIKNLNTTQLENTMTITTLEVSLKREKLSLKHIKWNNWPDRGVPEHKMAPFRLLGRINSVEPVVIHCSDGIGRTGTIVGLHMALQVLSGSEDLLLANVVTMLRESRHGSVQMDVEYVYMYRALMALAENKHAIQINELEPFVTEYERFIKSQGN